MRPVEKTGDNDVVYRSHQMNSHRGNVEVTWETAPDTVLLTSNSNSVYVFTIMNSVFSYRERGDGPTHHIRRSFSDLKKPEH